MATIRENVPFQILQVNQHLVSDSACRRHPNPCLRLLSFETVTMRCLWERNATGNLDPMRVLEISAGQNTKLQLLSNTTHTIKCWWCWQRLVNSYICIYTYYFIYIYIYIQVHINILCLSVFHALYPANFEDGCKIWNQMCSVEYPPAMASCDNDLDQQMMGDLTSKSHVASIYRSFATTSFIFGKERKALAEPRNEVVSNWRATRRLHFLDDQCFRTYFWDVTRECCRGFSNPQFAFVDLQLFCA